MGCVEFVIAPEPAEDERVAVVAAIEQLGTFAPRPAARWGRPDLELGQAADAWYACPDGWAPSVRDRGSSRGAPE
jgi:hypothetical protein